MMLGLFNNNHTRTPLRPMGTIKKCTSASPYLSFSIIAYLMYSTITLHLKQMEVFTCTYDKLKFLIFISKTHILMHPTFTIITQIYGKKIFNIIHLGSKVNLKLHITSSHVGRAMQIPNYKYVKSIFTNFLTSILDHINHR